MGFLSFFNDTQFLIYGKKEFDTNKKAKQLLIFFSILTLKYNDFPFW